MDKLLYSYTSTWDSTSLQYSLNYPNSIIFHPDTKRIIQNGVIYGNGEGGPIYIKGSGSTNGTWKGTSNLITEYYEGLSIIYVPDKNGGSSTTTLNINNLGEKTCYWTGTSVLTTQFPVDTPIMFTYYNNGWRRADYNYNSNTFETATKATSTDATYYVGFFNRVGDVSKQYAYVTNQIQFNPSKSILSSYIFQTYDKLNNQLGYFYGNLVGNADTATEATHAITSNLSNSTYTNIIKTTDSSTATYYITLSNTGTNNTFSYSYIDTGLKFIPNTNKLIASIFEGNLNGNAATATSAISATNSTNTTYIKVEGKDSGTGYNIVFVSGSGDAKSAYIGNNLLYDVTGSKLKSTYFVGWLQGTADNAIAAEKWKTARTFTIGNTGKSVDGSGNVTWTLSEIGAATSGHTHDDRYVKKTGDTMSGDLTFSHGSSTTDQHITWASGTHYQRLKVRDGQTDVFIFQYSTDSGSTWSNYFTIQQNKALIGTNTVLHDGNIGLYVGGSGDLTANSEQTTNGNVYLTLKAAGVYFKHNIIGGTGISVTSDANGKITITNSAPNEDTKVTQTLSTSSNTDFRPLIVSGVTNSSAVTPTFATGTGTVISMARLYAKPSTGDLYLYNPDGGDSPFLYFQRGDFNTSSILDWRMYVTAGNFHIQNNYNGWHTALFIDYSADKVGLGTTSPSYKLHVNNGNAGIINTAANTSTALLTIQNNYSGTSQRALDILIPNQTTTGHSNIIIFGVAHSTNNQGVISFGYRGSGSTSNYVSIGVYSTDNILNVVASKKVGINTVTPSEALDVNGNARIQGNNGYFGTGSNAQCHMQYDDTNKCMKFIFD